MISSLLMLLLQPVVVAAEPVPVAGEVVADAAPTNAAVPEAPPPAPAGVLLPKTTALIIAIDKELGSKISRAGETFPIRLVDPVVVDGVEVLPAGITGQGEVVHAKKAGLAGAAGELVLAARHLDFDGRRIELRSFRFMEAGESSLGKGQDNTGVSNVTTAIAGPIGFFIGGGNTNVMPGTIANAKTRNDEFFERAGAPTPPAAAVEPVQNEGGNP